MGPKMEGRACNAVDDDDDDDDENEDDDEEEVLENVLLDCVDGYSLDDDIGDDIGNDCK